MSKLSKNVLKHVTSSTYVSAIPLASVGKYNGFGRHVDSDAERFRGAQSFDQSLREENFYDLFQNGKATSNEIEERSETMRYIFIR